MNRKMQYFIKFFVAIISTALLQFLWLCFIDTLIVGSKTSLSVFDYLYRWLIILILGILSGSLLGSALSKRGISQRLRNFLLWTPTIVSNVLVLPNIVIFTSIARGFPFPRMEATFGLGGGIWLFTSLFLVLTFPLNLIWNITNLWLTRKRVLVIITLTLILLCMAFLQSSLCMRVQNILFD